MSRFGCGLVHLLVAVLTTQASAQTSDTLTARDEPSTPTQAPASEDDAAGWGAGTGSGGAIEPLDATLPRSFHVGGKFRERAGVWLKRAFPSRLAQLRSSLELNASYSKDFLFASRSVTFRGAAGGRGEYDLAFRIHREHYDAQTLDTYERRLIVLESYVAMQGKLIELRTGRLFNPLGQGEILSCVDVLNPRDVRQVGLTDPELMRLPAWTTRFAIATDTHRLEAIIVHEATFGMFPPLLGRFSPARKLIVEDELAGAELADHEWRIRHEPRPLDKHNTQGVARYQLTAHGVDLELVAGSVLDQLGVSGIPSARQLERRVVTLLIHHPRYSLIASSAAVTVGDFVLRWEGSAQLDRPQAVRRKDLAPPVLDMERRTQLNGLLGLTYFGMRDVNVGAEVMKSVVLDRPRQDAAHELLWPVEAPSFALRYQQQLLRERLQLSLIAMLIGVSPFNGAVATAGVGAQLRDGLWLRAEYAHYQPSSHFGVFYGFEQNDRLDLTLSWAFALI